MNVDNYLIPVVLESQTWVYPCLQWMFPASHRWNYTSNVERLILKLVARNLNWTNIRLTEGMFPEYDATVDTDLVPITVEIKTTDKEEIFVEGGRVDMSQSGLSISTADVYLFLSRKMIVRPDGGFHYIGKLRLCFRDQLISKYMELVDEGREFAYPSSEYGPGARGIKFTERELPHIWLGDVACIVEDGVARYNLAKFKTIYKTPDRAKFEFYDKLEKYRSRIES